MISTLKRRASRIGLANVKIMVTIDVMELIAPNDDSIPNHSMLSVCFERGGKISSTSNKLFNKEELDGLNNPLQTKIVLKSVVFPIYESVTIIATLYKDVKTGSFQEKTGKIILRQLKKNSMFNSETYRGLALHDLRLDELVNDLQAQNATNGTNHTSHSVERDLQMDILTGAVLKVIITTNLLNEELEPQEEHDQLTSAMSFMVDDHNLPEDETIIGATFEDNKKDSRVNSKRRKSRMSYMLVSESSLNLATQSSDQADSPPQMKKQSTLGENNKILTHSISNLFNNDNFGEDAVPVTMESPVDSRSAVRAVTPPPSSATADASAVRSVTPPPPPSAAAAAVSASPRGERADSASSARSKASSVDVDGENDDDEEEEESFLKGRASMLNRDDVQLFQNTFKNSGGAAAEEDDEVILLEVPEDRDQRADSSSSAAEGGANGIAVDGAAAEAAAVTGQAVTREPSDERVIPLDLNVVADDDEDEAAGVTREEPAVPSSAKSNKLRTPANRRSHAAQQKHKKHHDQNGEDDDESAGSSEDEELEDGEGENDDPTQNELTVASGVAIKKSRRRVKKIAANKEAFRIFTQEIEAKSNRIAALELILTQQSQEYQTKLLKLTEQLELVEAENKALRDIVNQVDVVRESIIAVSAGAATAGMNDFSSAAEMAASLNSTHSALSAAAGAKSGHSSVDDIDLADEYLKRVSILLAPSIDSTGAAGLAAGPSVSVDSNGVVTYAMYAKVTAENQAMKDEVQFLKNSLTMAQQAKAEETAAAREAATEAVRANMRRADMQQENEEVLEELIQIKMKMANLAIDYEQQKLLNITYQRRIQVYAEQLTNMEVQETIRAHSITPAESPFKHRMINSTMNGKVTSNAAAVVTTSERVMAARRNSAKSLGSMAYAANTGAGPGANPPTPISPTGDTVTVTDKATVMVKL